MTICRCFYWTVWSAYTLCVINVIPDLCLLLVVCCQQWFLYFSLWLLAKNILSPQSKRFCNRKKSKMRFHDTFGNYVDRSEKPPMRLPKPVSLYLVGLLTFRCFHDHFLIAIFRLFHKSRGLGNATIVTCICREDITINNYLHPIAKRIMDSVIIDFAWWVSPFECANHHIGWTGILPRHSDSLQMTLAARAEQPVATMAQ